MSTFILALLVVLGIALPVSVILSRVESAEEHTEDTPHEGPGCRHCAALAVPPGLIGTVSIPRQPGGEEA
ncbi:hypothetical protein [Streptomyces niveus]|uniref:hypothetical protein n=1 Tax=Streptomyces niveus TaxID=193462 RepID=UPI0035D8CF57